MVYTSVANDSDRHAGHQGGRERGFLAQIGSSLVTILPLTHGFDRNSVLLDPRHAQKAADAARASALVPGSHMIPSSLVLDEILVAIRPYQAQHCCLSSKTQHNALENTVGDW